MTAAHGNRACKHLGTRLLAGFAAVIAIYSGLGLLASLRVEGAHLALAAAAGLALSLIIIGATVKRFCRPVNELKNASMAMTQGDLSRRVHIDTRDEIADLARTFNLMADSVQQKIRQLTSLSDIALAISSELDWERVVDIVMEKGMELTDSQAAAIALYDGQLRAFTETYTRGLSDAFVKRMQFRPGGLAEQVLLGDRVVFSDGVHASYKPSKLAHEEGISAFICLPLKVGKRRLGVFYVYSKTAETYGTDEHSVLSILSNQAAIAIQNAQIFKRTQEEAITDGLTGLYNQKYFYTRLNEEIERTCRSRKPLSLIFCDLDKFKAFNDLNGHGLGDRALKDVALIITGSKRSIDVAARYGGEEFAIILPETDSSGAQIIAHRIRRRVADFVFETKSRSGAPVTASIGVASYPDDAAQIKELIDKADWCMYYGKRQGGNRVTVFHEEEDGYSQFPLADLARNELSLDPLQTLAQTVDGLGSLCQRRAESVARLAAEIATGMGLSAEEVYRIRVAGLVHDIGLVSVPLEIMNKREHLTESEWEKIKAHPEVGTAIIQHIASLEGFLPAIRHHHEHYDGAGYPDGLARDRIPLAARIIAVADAYQAMICERPYRKTRSVSQAVRELERGSGSQFDPEVVCIFVNLMKEQEARQF
ncbi:MAG: diguanylate cyclase [Thermoleophilia bacterium]|nr:diguanylate cyclase [Thermoleophilia bacterium]